MRLSIRRVFIAATVLAFVSSSAFTAAKKVQETGQADIDQKSSVVQAKKVTLKEPVQSTIDITTKAPIEVQAIPTPINAPVVSSGQAAVYSMDWFVIASGGGSGTSTNYAMGSTAGQTAVGEGTSTNYNLNSGFWQNFPPPSCCVGLRGSPNGDAVEANILDLNYTVNKIFRGGPLAVCFEEGNFNGDANSLNILDLNYIVNKIFRGGPLPVPCPTL